MSDFPNRLPTLTTLFKERVNLLQPTNRTNPMPNPDNLEAEATRNKISQLIAEGQSENDRLRRRIHMLELLLGDMLEDKLKNPPRRRSLKPQFRKPEE